MAQQDKLTYEGTFNHASTGLFKDNTAGDIEAVDHRLQVTNTKDSVPFTLDDSYTWPFPQVTATGTDTYAATLSPAITAYATGQKFQIKFTNASSGVSTLNLNAVGAKKIFVNPTTQATVAHIVAGQISLLVYDAALDAAAGGFLMIGAPSTGGGGTVTAVDGTADRITSTGGATPAIDISTTFEALLGKIAQRIDQNNSATTSAQLAATLTDETGTGAAVFANSPTLVTPALGTPSAVVLTNGTGLPGTAVINTPAGAIAATTVQAAINELDSEKQPIDADLTDIAALTPSNDDVLQRKAGAWTNRTVVQFMVDLGITVGLASVDTTGTAITFAVPQIYNSSGTPGTGNITLVTTGLQKGMVQVLYHDDASEPSYPAEFVKIGGEDYEGSTLNIYYMHAISTARIEYTISHEI